MKILAINDVKKGGGAELVFQKSLKLLQNDHEMFSYTAKEEHKLNWKEAFGYIFSFSHASKLKKKIFEIRPDVVHLHNFYHFLSPSILWTLNRYKKELGFKVFMTIHDYHFLCANNGCLRWKNKQPITCEACKGRNYLQILFKQCDPRGFFFNLLKFLQHFLAYKILKLDEAIDTFIVPSKFLRKKMLSFCKKEKLLFLANPAFGLQEALKEKQKISHKFESIFIGRVCPEKGLKRFIEEDYQAQKFGSFLIIGQSDKCYQKELEKSIQKHNLQDYICFAGPKTHSEALSYLSSAKRLIFPSIWYENCPLTVLEAKALKKEIFHYKVGAIPEIVQEKENSLDEEQYSRKLQAIFFEKELSL